MTRYSLESIRNCLEGIVPSAIATCDDNGLPNVAYLSQILYVDPQHIALSFQFFNNTRDNILRHPRATVLVIDPDCAARYRLAIHYLQTRTEGPLFERMKAKLAGIASHEGLVGIFKLRGADIYRVLSIEKVPGPELPVNRDPAALLPALRGSIDAMGRFDHLEELVDTLLDSIDRFFGIRYQMVLLPDPSKAKLYTLASRGYRNSGVGAEIPVGVGVIGVAAREQVPIRIMFAASEYVYSRAVREQAIRGGAVKELETVIPLPGLANPASQMAVPILANNTLMGVLFVESEQVCQFGYDIEDALVILCAHAGLAMQQLQSTAISAPDLLLTAQTGESADCALPLKVCYHQQNHSIFIDDDYLIKGVAGAILWRLLGQFSEQGRSDFSNRELRLDRSLPLPEIVDNLEARLLLLSRRLRDRCSFIRLEKSARGRFRLLVDKPLQLIDQS